MKKTITIFIVSACLLITFVSVSVFADSQLSGMAKKYFQYGQLRNGAELKSEETTVATIEGEPFTIDNYDNEIKGCILMGFAETDEEALHYLLTQELLKREAKERNIVVDDETVDEFIKEQKANCEEDPEFQNIIAEYARGLGITEDEYWDVCYEDYRNLFIVGSLRKEMYDEFLYDKVVERIDELGWELNDEEIQEVYEDEKSSYNQEIRAEFNKYYQEYQENLFTKYNVEMVDKDF